MVWTDVQKFCTANLRPKKQVYIYDRHKKYMRVCSGFDIETTRIEKHAFMYHWQFAYNNDVVLGRTWDEFTFLLNRINDYVTYYNARIIVWVANLGHEFAFLGRRYHWTDIFAKESHQPLKAQTGGIEFRECLAISGQGGLAELAKKYCNTRKMVGDLDYSIIRNSKTPLTEKELQYNINDVVILAEWAEYIFATYSDKKLNIPLTSTGIVNSLIQSAAEQTGHIKEIREGVQQLFPTREIYNFIMMFLFRGGYTHANVWYVMIPTDNVIGDDYTSSYPAEMLTRDRYPKSPFVETELKASKKYIIDERMQTMCVWCIVDIAGIDRKTMHAIESEHKLISYTNAKFDNGRLISADKIRVAITELDYEIYLLYYDWETISVVRAFTAFRGRLPEYVLKPLRDAYQTKNRIKRECKKAGIDPDTIPEYRNAKATINSFYGLMVKRLNFKVWNFEEETGKWYQTESEKTYEQQIKNKILSPYWGIYVTALARYKLLKVVIRMDDPETNDFTDAVLYNDTDSLYYIDTPRNRAIIQDYNRYQAKINAEILPPECNDIGLFEPVAVDKNGDYQHYTFMSLGAKRYIKYHDDPDDETGGSASVTVAGMRKGSYEKSLVRTFATDHCYKLYEKPKKKEGFLGYVDVDELFANFDDNLLLTVDQSQKNATSYDPNEYSETVTDQYGNTEIMCEKSGVAIVPITFKISMDDVYLELVKNIFEERRIPNWK